MASSHHPVLARLYDVVMMPSERRGLRQQRIRMCRTAPGRVLEIAVGTGLNLPHYERADIIIGIDRDPAMLRRANRKRHTAMIPVRLVEADARALPFRSGTFTTVVIGLALCTISDPGLALAEARRVSADGDELHFLEHVRSAKPSYARMQDTGG